MKVATAAILMNPDFPEILGELNEAWKDEQQRRAVFREELTPEMKAEFIEGQVIMHSPAMARHILASKHLSSLLDTWVAEHGLGLVTVEKALICLSRNDFEPDIAFFKDLRADTIDPLRLEFPAPNMVVEVLSPGTEKTDRGVKMRDYAYHGVLEYWLVECKTQTVERYLLDVEARTFAHAETIGTDGEISSDVVAGFRIPVRAIFDEKERHEALRSMFARR